MSARSAVFAFLLILFPLSLAADVLQERELAFKVGIAYAKEMHKRYKEHLPDWAKRIDVDMKVDKDYRSTWSLACLQPLNHARKAPFFCQAKIAHRLSGETLNFGVGKRYVLHKDQILLGINAFYDAASTRSSLHRMSIGAEIMGFGAALRTNIYSPILKSRTEIPLAGWDTEIGLPLLSKLRLSGKLSDWDHPTKGHLREKRLALLLALTPFLSFEMGHKRDSSKQTDNFAVFCLSFGKKPLDSNEAFETYKVKTVSASKKVSKKAFENIQRQNSIIAAKK